MPYIDPPNYEPGEWVQIVEINQEEEYLGLEYRLPRYAKEDNDGFRVHPEYTLYEANSVGDIRRAIY